MNTHTRVRGRVIGRVLVAWLTVSGGGLAVAAEPLHGAQGGTGAAGQTNAASDPAPQPVLGAHARYHHILTGTREVVTGTLSTGERGRTVLAEVNRGRGWKRAVRASTKAGGRFTLAWRPRSLGRYGVRVVLDSRTAKRNVRGGLIVYRRSYVSWYGPGFYGHRTACGRTLSPHTLGVANKHLRCGTKVTLRYGRRMVTVPVIDRGPYVAGREYDLTAATRNRLHFGSTGTLWSAPNTR